MIETHEVKNQKEHYFTAICPACPYTERTDVDESAELAKKVAKGKVLAHAKQKHPDLELDKDLRQDDAKA